MSSITHIIFFWEKHVTVLYLVALLYDREDLNCLSGHVDFFSPKQHNAIEGSIF